MTQPKISSEQLDTGTGVDSVVKLEGIGSPQVPGLPVVDGSQLLNVTSSGLVDETIEAGPVSSITTTVDFDSHEFEYLVNASGRISGSGTTSLVLVLNGDTSASNYRSQVASFTTSTSYIRNDAWNGFTQGTLTTGGPPAWACTMKVVKWIDLDATAVFIDTVYSSSSSLTSLFQSRATIIHVPGGSPISNLTSIGIHTTASGTLSNSRMRTWRILR